MADLERRQDSGRAVFVARYGGIYEDSPWVAERAYERLSGDADESDVARTLAACVDEADAAQKLALIRAHPDLAGKAALQGELSGDSAAEQSSAGIDQCTAEEFARFQRLNDAYTKKFGFPFVIAVRGRDRHEILRAFAERLENDAGKEFDTAIAEIHRIAALRLSAMASDWQTR